MVLTMQRQTLEQECDWRSGVELGLEVGGNISGNNESNSPSNDSKHSTNAASGAGKFPNVALHVDDQQGPESKVEAPSGDAVESPVQNPDGTSDGVTSPRTGAYLQVCDIALIP